MIRSLLIANRGTRIRLAWMGLVLNLVASPASASANSCLSVVRAWNDAVDCQVTDAVGALTWADGYSQWPGSGRGKWSEIRMSGPCGKYATTFKRVRVFPIVGMSQIVEVKAITRRNGFDDQYTNEYTVTKASYTCQQRKGQWRIYSKVVTQRTDLQNKAVVRRYEKVR
jgi:hypothetical protein